MKNGSRYRLGVDVGGTHTDLVLLDVATGALSVEKVSSTPANPALGVLNGVANFVANRVLTAIPVREELRAPPIIVVKRSDVPLAPAATFLLDLVKRSAGHLTAGDGALAGQALAPVPAGRGRAARTSAR